ncbi:Thiol:disulfide interchange protein DsbD precursor [Roseimaritima multifibrata]|uniref:Thiol:disulfide interchange protein DsbD n=1 Tax=Roseimaritima multifibrata TaxID=1930274 RepID=A0A517MKT1_9BACT|nr:thioredoxin family protein [Roseimaritima multifibrata]QDS95484.1 Thiol:disulfide interchange protein DsbD precursor [Roseimaritima multifibrata]
MIPRIRPMQFRRLWQPILAVVVLALAGPLSNASAQLGNGFPSLSFPNEDANGDVIELQASFEAADEGAVGRLHIDAKLSPAWHVYSTTQPPGGPLPTKFTMADGSQAKLLSPFVSDKDPKRSQAPEWPDVTIEEFETAVRWTAEIEFAAGVQPDAAVIKIKANGLTCQTGGSCRPFEMDLTAAYKGTYQPVTTEATFRDGDYAVEWTGELLPATAKPGDAVELKLTANPDASFHVYPGSIKDENFATNFVLTKRGVLQPGMPTPSEDPVTLDTPIGEATYQKGKTTWTIELKIPEDAVPGTHPVEGYIAYQACQDTSCLLPKGLRFQTELQVGENGKGAPAAVQFASAKRAEVMDFIAETKWDNAPEAAAAPTVYGQETKKSYSVVMMLLMGLGAGLILNLMPCVLPVLGLKLMSLTDQAGQDRKAIFSSNMWYSLGVLSVFWVLAGLASFFSFGWGEQFTHIEFKLALTVLIFAMALSFLGVWEIPVPGFASGKFSQEMQHHEGAVGAYSKGLFTTVIATPCGGPLLGLVLGLLLGQSPLLIFAVFTAMGIGMSLPFLLIGVSPRLVSWLPKPGAWMETLKQLMAFVLLGTVAFFFNMFSDDQKLPVFVALIGVWFGCWMIGKVPNWETLSKRLASWGAGVASAALIGFLAFRFLMPGDVIVPWQPYDEAKLTQLRSEGKTVMIDFTASWCATCKWNYHSAINTDSTADLLAELDVVPMLADWSDYNEEIKKKLIELESQSIPLLAIYPGNSPDQPIILRDLVNQADVLGALQLAGPSQGEAAAASGDEISVEVQSGGGKQVQAPKAGNIPAAGPVSLSAL